MWFATLYRYRFTTWRQLRETGAWWERTPAGIFREPVGRGTAPRAGSQDSPDHSRD
jgi:hypothetical protein